MTHTARRGGRLIRARPILLLIPGITFFGGMWSESVDRLWEAQFLVNIGVPAFGGLQLDHLVRCPERGRGAARDRGGAAALTSVRARELAWHDWSLFWLDGVMVVTTLAFAFAGDFAAAVLAYWGICVARSLAGSDLLDVAQREHRGLERARDGHLHDESRRLGRRVGRRPRARAWWATPSGSARHSRPERRPSTPALLLYGLALRRGDETTTFDIVPQPEG